LLDGIKLGSRLSGFPKRADPNDKFLAGTVDEDIRAADFEGQPFGVRLQQLSDFIGRS
jgi:hypothetical protein